MDIRQAAHTSRDLVQRAGSNWNKRAFDYVASRDSGHTSKSSRKKIQIVARRKTTPSLQLYVHVGATRQPAAQPHARERTIAARPTMLGRFCSNFRLRAGRSSRIHSGEGATLARGGWETKPFYSPALPRHRRARGNLAKHSSQFQHLFTKISS